MKSVVRGLVLLGLLAAGAAAGWYWWIEGSKRPLTTLVVYGNVDVRQVQLAINGTERIGKLLVEEGDRIDPGQLLATLELERFELEVSRARAAVEHQRQVVAELVAGSRPEEIAKAKADLAAAQALARDAEETYRRNLVAFEKKAIARQDLEDSRAAFETAKAKAQAAKATLDLVLAGPRVEDIAQAKAQLKQLEAELAIAEHNLRDSHLYAPAEAIVQERLLEVGEMATPLRPVYTVALVDPVWIRAYVSEPDLGKVFEGMKAEVTTDSYPNKKYEGWVGFISPTAEFTPKPVETRELRTKLVYQIRVFVKNPNNELRLGMPATVTLRLDQPRVPQRKSKSEQAN